MDMSGSSFLQEIVNWDEKKCVENVEDTIPRLILFLENRKSFDEAIGVLHILCHSFLPIIQHDQLEEKLFNKMSHQVCEMMDGVIEALHDAAASQDMGSGLLVNFLQHTASVLKYAEVCVKHAAGLADVQSHQVRSLVSCTFHVLSKSYSHCQESSSLYGDQLPALSDSLSLIFRSAHSLQMALLNLLDKLSSAHGESKETTQDIAHICDRLFALCRVVSTLDLKLTISLWKALSKLAGPKAHVLHDHIDLAGVIGYLCEEISTGVNHLLQSAPLAEGQHETMLSQGDEKVFMKSLRILGFQMKLLTALVRDFHEYLSDCVTSIYKVLLLLNSVLRPNLSACRLRKNLEVEFRQQLCSAVQPVVSYVLTNATFLCCVVDEEEKSECGRLLLQMTVMDSVGQSSEEVMAGWFDISVPTRDNRPASSLLSAVFTSLSSCHTEVCLPVHIVSPPCQGTEERTLSLYQFVIEHVCAFIAGCPARLFPFVEKELLQGILCSNPISYQAAADCWSFLARYGEAELCWHHTQQLLSLLLHARCLAPQSPCLPLLSLLSRLIKFLTPQHQTSLVCLLPPASHVDMWCEVGVSVLSGEVAREVSLSLLPPCLSALRSFSQLPCPSLAQAAHVIPSVKCLHKIVVNEASAPCLTHQHKAGLVSALSSLWTAAPSDLPASSPAGQEHALIHSYWSALLTLTSDLLHQLEVKVLLKVLVIGQRLLTESTSQDVALAVLKVLQAFGPLKLPPSAEEGQILQHIGSLFGSALTHPLGAVQFRGLEAFARFAEQTAYEAVVPQCLAQRPGLQDRVAAFLHKVPLEGGQQFDAVTYLREQQRQFSARLQSGGLPGKPAGMGPDKGPLCKRKRLEDSTRVDHAEDSYQKVLDELEMLTQRLERLRKDRGVEHWTVTRGKALLGRLSACLDQ